MSPSLSLCKSVYVCAWEGWRDQWFVITAILLSPFLELYQVSRLQRANRADINQNRDDKVLG